MDDFLLVEVRKAFENVAGKPFDDTFRQQGVSFQEGVQGASRAKLKESERE